MVSDITLHELKYDPAEVRQTLDKLDNKIEYIDFDDEVSKLANRYSLKRSLPQSI